MKGYLQLGMIMLAMLVLGGCGMNENEAPTQGNGEAKPYAVKGIIGMMSRWKVFLTT
ncbi:hypothetical protein Q8G35_09300 [Peribacillus simplex]|uniref:Uncharacterized protein n=2 Tax=Peribacillus TaxID=2675229 RepID=A0AA90P9K4_9BACI|nr:MULTISPECIES: hypothetical protein [Peribacillus]MDP1418608.1 hypothetical protein [Peribacillus simplex]MDP1451414.1 hypothetical protein [Peribacillus frigoritolerans]